VVRRNSFNSDVIPWREHEGWFGRRLVSADTRIYILEEGDRPVAQIRYEKRDSTAEVGDISVAASDRGKGYGKRVLLETLSLACEELKIRELFAVVKYDNAASLRAFLSAGFVLEGEIWERGTRCSRFTYPCPCPDRLQLR